MRFLLVAAFALLAAGCALLRPAAPIGLMDIVQRPAEKALFAGIRAYDDAQYTEAETQLTSALRIGLPSAKDRAAARKHLAFIYCTSKRVVECEAAFRAARQADAGFALSKSESGHPLWGPVYKRVQP